MVNYGKDDDDVWHTVDGTFQGKSLPSHLIGDAQGIARERARMKQQSSEHSVARAAPQAPEPLVDATTEMALLRTYPILQYFKYDHLPPHLQAASKPYAEIAWRAAESTLGFHPEVEAGLRKLLEAKDCFVRSQLR